MEMMLQVGYIERVAKGTFTVSHSYTQQASSYFGVLHSHQPEKLNAACVNVKGRLVVQVLELKHRGRLQQ